MNSGAWSNLQRVMEAFVRKRGVVVFDKALVSIWPDWNDLVNLSAGFSGERGRKRIGLTIIGRMVTLWRWIRAPLIGECEEMAK